MASDLEVAQQTQEKFQFYVLALNFTLLAAAIQTATFGTYMLQDWLELAGWLGLVCAGVVGLWKLEWSSTIRVQHAKKEEVVSALNEARHRKAQGVREVFVLNGERMQDIDERIQNHLDAIALIDSNIRRLDRSDAAKYTFTKVAFLSGITLLVAARGVAALASLLGYDLLPVG